MDRRFYKSSDLLSLSTLLESIIEA